MSVTTSCFIGICYILNLCIIVNVDVYSCKFLFYFHFRPILTVNNVVHRANVAMSRGMTLSGGPIYLGGVPSSVVLVPELPVKNSLTGGIHELKINDK